MKKQEKFYIIDGNALIHRAWHALPPTMQTKDGRTVNAVYGFTSTLLKVIKDLKPDYLAATFDLAAPTFRHTDYAEYKATRVKQADELYEQFPLIKDVVRAFNIPIYEIEGFEADDVIATLVRRPEVEQIKSIIVTGDMDTLQLVDENTEVFTMRKGIADTITYNIAGVKEKYDGLLPNQMVDYKGLCGDASDNIPGVKGIGAKGAIALLKEFGTLENVFKNLNSEKIPKRYQALLAAGRESAFMSKKLAQLVSDVPIDFNLEQCRYTGFNREKVSELFQDLEFKSLISKLPNNDIEDAKTKPQGVRAVVNGANYRLIVTDELFDDFFEQFKKQKQFAIDTETSGLNPYTSKLVGISLCWEKNIAYYVIPAPDRLSKLKPILEDEKVKKFGHNIKFDMHVFAAAGISLKGITFDTMIAAYLINPGQRQHSLDNLVFAELGYQMQPITDLIGTGKKQISFADVPLDHACDYACEDADYTFQLVEPLRKQLIEKNNLELFETIEMPLVSVLAQMEQHGITLDTKFLEKMSKELGAELAQIEKRIYKIAGGEFNIASPKQLKEVLFEWLDIPTDGLSKTKTGISTAASELEKMKGLHPIIEEIVRFRELSKLKSTYLDALPKLVDKNGKIHTSYNQTIAATGRLSSTDPNLQNIPVKTDLGKKIRCAFIAEKGNKILSADYSQIELRIIASLADDKKMIETFKRGIDIHTQTAAEINGVTPDAVTPQMRYAAKAINFGIIYGQGAWGLSETAGISRQQAKEFIDKYFSVHVEIKNYIEKMKADARKKGYAETFFGRRRYLPEINSSMSMVAAAAERAAINHPIQGTQADLIKMAMIQISNRLSNVCPHAKMLLQVHDELVFEVPEKDVKKVAEFVQQEMAAVYTLAAPVKTDVEVGNNWGELEKL